MSKKTILLAALIVIVAAFVIVPHVALANNYTVTSGADSGAGTLREAVGFANANAGADTITFTVATVTLSSWIGITDAVTITGPVTISGGGATTIFVINAGVNVTLSSMTLTGANGGGNGGAIINSGSLTITNSILSGNQAAASSGAIFNTGAGSLTVTSSTFINNTAAFQGGAIGSNSSNDVSVASTLFTNNVGGAGGDDIYQWSGGVNVGGSCINGNGGAGDDVYINGTYNIDNNWWGTSTGPNTGVGSVNLSAPYPPYLTSAPACGPTGGGGGGGAGSAGVPPDDRINWQHGDGYAIFYARYDEHAEPVLHTYCVSAEGKGTLELIVTQEMLDKYPEFPDKPAHNRELFHSSVCRTPFFFYILTTGEYQINVGPDWEGKTDVIIFTGMPPGHVYFYSYDVFHPIDW